MASKPRKAIITHPRNKKAKRGRFCDKSVIGCFEFCFWHWLSYIASGVNVSQCLYLSYLLEVINSQCHCPTDPGINVPVGLFSAYDQFTLDYIFIRIIVTVKK